MCLAVSGSLLGQGEVDPNDIWYRAFLLVQAAEEDEAKGQHLHALNKLNDAEPLYRGLAERFPDFQPEIVRQRRHLILEKRDSLRNLMRNRGTHSGAGRAVPHSPSVASPTISSNSISSNSQFAPPPMRRVETLDARPEFLGPDSHPNAPGTEFSEEVTISTDSGGIPLPSWDDRSSRTQPRPNAVIGNPPPPGAVAGSLLEDLEKKENLIDYLNRENLDLKQQLADQDRAVREAVAEVELARRERDRIAREMHEKLANGATRSDARVRQLESLLAQALDQLDKANALNKKLFAEVESSRSEIGRLRERLAMVERERDSLLEVVKGNGTGGKALKELMDRNRKLSEQLDRAEQLASSLSELNKKKDADIALLKSEIQKVRVERDRLVAESETHQKSIDELQRKLRMLSDGLSLEERESLTEVSALERQENELLRSLVLKQLRRQAQLKQAKELILRQLDSQVGDRAEKLYGLIEDMATGPQLTEEEKALFRTPQFAEIIEAASPPDSADDSSTADPPPANGTNVVSATLVAAGDGAAPGDSVIDGQKLSVELEQIEKAARLDFQERRYAEAEAGFLRYLHFRPRSVSCLCNLGILKIAMKNYSEAQNFLERALALDEESGLAYYLLGRVFFLQGDDEAALENLEKGLVHEPENAKAHNCVGVISSRKGWVGRAEKAFSEAVTLDPQYGDAHFNLAVLYATREEPDPEKVQRHYIRARDLGIPRDDAIESFLQRAQGGDVTLGMRFPQ